MKYCYFVAYCDASLGAFGNIQVWLDTQEISTADHVEALHQTIANVHHTQRKFVAVLSWARLPGEDKEDDEKPDSNVTQFKKRK